MINKTQQKIARRKRRHARIRSQVSGTALRPRLAVVKTNTALYVQLIDDVKGVTLAAASSRTHKTGAMKEKAVLVGKQIAEIAQEKGITQAVFDRGGFVFTGNIKALADAAREAGLAF